MPDAEETLPEPLEIVPSRVIGAGVLAVVQGRLALRAALVAHGAQDPVGHPR